MMMILSHIKQWLLFHILSNTMKSHLTYVYTDLPINNGDLP